MVCVRPERDFEGMVLVPSGDRKELILGDVGGDSSFVESLTDDPKLAPFPAVPLLGDSLRKDNVSTGSSGTPVLELVS